MVKHFTVGRHSEVTQLQEYLRANKSCSVLLQANYGSGKTHLLRFLRESALSSGFVVSAVTLDAKSAVRFNRMDQILGAIFRNLELPTAPGARGLRGFFDLMLSSCEKHKAGGSHSGFWADLTHGWKWDYSDQLNSPALFAALRAWSTGNGEAQELVEDWLQQPWNYKSQRKKLYSGLVDSLRKYFRDPRADWQFYADNVFAFDVQGYSQSWAALGDLNRLTQAAGLSGVVLLFDEFEDIITNLTNIAHQQAAFWNLFQFYSRKHFAGLSFYAVTPEFVDKCKRVLIKKGCFDYDYEWFEALSRFQMSPLSTDELGALARRIMDAHGKAYDWEPDLVMKASQLRSIVEHAASIQIQDRARHTIITVVRSLDGLLQEQE
jgi:hypothetical protein